MTGANFCFPILNSMASKRVHAQHRGRMMGATGSAAAWGRVIGPLATGASVTLVGYSLAWGVLFLLGLYYVYWAYFIIGSSEVSDVSVDV